MIEEQIKGYEQVIARFGRWPSFHDAEVVSVLLERGGPNGPSAEMFIHAWSMTNQADARGFMVLENHTLVRLAFEKMVECNLSDFNQQNVLLSLRIEPAEPTLKGFFRVVLDTSSGLTGYILCKQLTVLDVLPCNSTGKPIL